MSGFEKGICGCCSDMSLCLLGTCCPCYVSGKVAESTGRSCLLHGILALTPIRLCTGTFIRGKIREKYHLEGNAATDFLANLCCGCCATIQEAHEVQNRGDGPPGMCMTREWRHYTVMFWHKWHDYLLRIYSSSDCVDTPTYNGHSITFAYCSGLYNYLPHI